ncbi:RNA polymerase subunit sigma-24 [Pseudoalteromonas sp. NBT06-2]|uniref:DUF1835 domain-containing protein n=1 Tax=Pseudoalteromonas sp. NBT06-2 TaxID=2025950 RepID=UPI000BA5B080|nr:DUF1835 domain-containing protein [Pseudoalteromonas sp. NBT06-2]PAJ73247.1 RNA polymerase subunit sigma-24 [Pseudoalteromonas sp. NBT06-2]
MIHITNGDNANRYLKQVGIEGQFQAWQDVLHHGPITAETNLNKITEYRSQFLAEFFCIALSDIKAKFNKRDQALLSLAPEDEVVLWLTPELFDCLIGLQFLAWFNSSHLRKKNLKVIMVPDHLPPKEHDSEHIQRYFQTRFTPAPAFYKLANQVWQALILPSDQRSIALKKCLALEFKYWPSLKLAITRFLEETPSAPELSRTQWQILDILLIKPLSLAQLFGENQQLEEIPFMGDLSFWCTLEMMRELVDIDTQECILHQERMFYHLHQVSLSEQGMKVITGDGYLT